MVRLITVRGDLNSLIMALGQPPTVQDHNRARISSFKAIIDNMRIIGMLKPFRPSPIDHKGVSIRKGRRVRDMITTATTHGVKKVLLIKTASTKG